MMSLEPLIPFLKRPGIFFADSRQIVPGGIFFALKGARVDGHAFLKQVADNQAFGAVVSSDYQGPSYGLELFYVSSVVQALQDLAERKRDLYSHQKVIGITGSVGKTTTKEFVAQILSESFKVYKTKGSENSQVTLPLTLLNADVEAEWIVLEMGMSLKGEMERLALIAQPDIAMITRIGYSHAGNFETIDEIAQEKGAILKSPRIHTMVISQQVAEFEPFKGFPLRRLLYSSDDVIPPLPLPFEPAHLMENLKGAVAIARSLGMSWDEIRRACLKLQPFDRRFQKVVKKGITFINDAYNASEMSTVAALTHLPTPLGQGKKIAVLGEMRELGSFSEQAHTNVGRAAGKCVDHLLTFGEETQWCVAACGTKAERFEGKETLLIRLRELVSEGDVVLIKGSNSLKMWTLIEEF